MTDDDILAFVIDVEGQEFKDDPNDAGGATKYGITQSTLGWYRNVAVTKDDVRDLSETEARAIYAKRYLAHFTMVGPAELRWIVVDCAVLHGISAATKMLQRALEITDDGLLGPGTIVALGSKAFAWRKTFAAVLCERVLLFDAIIAAKASQAEYGRGWDAKRVVPFVKALA